MFGASKAHGAYHISGSGWTNVGAPAILPNSTGNYWGGSGITSSPNVVWQDTTSSATYTSASSVLTS